MSCRKFRSAREPERTQQLLAPAVAEEGRLPIAGQPPLYPAPQPLQIPLDVDVVLEHERAPVAVLEDHLDRSRVSPESRDDALVDLPARYPFVRVPQRRSDIQLRVRGDELAERAGCGVRLEKLDPVAAVRGVPRVVARRKGLVRIGRGCLDEPVVAYVQAAECRDVDLACAGLRDLCRSAAAS